MSSAGPLPNAAFSDAGASGYNLTHLDPLSLLVTMALPQVHVVRELVTNLPRVLE